MAGSTMKHLIDIGIDVASKHIKSCVGSAMQTQLVKVKGAQKSSSVNIKCIFSAEMQTAIQTDLAKNIENLGVMDIKHLFNTNINYETVSKQVASTLKQQTLSAEDVDGSVIIADVDPAQAIAIVATAMINSSQYLGVFNTIAQHLDSKDTTFGVLGYMLIITLFIAVGAVVYYIVYIKGRRWKIPAPKYIASPIYSILPPPL